MDLAGGMSATGTVSLVFGIVSVVLALVALVLAGLQTRQLKQSISKLENTESALNSAQTGISNLSERMSTTLAQMQDSVVSLSNEMYSVLGIAQAARDVPGLFDRVRKTIEACADVLPCGSPFLASFVARQLETLNSQADQARAGSIELRSSDIAQVALELIELADEGDEVFATSYVNTSEFWTRPFAKRYLRRSEELIAEKSVRITRVFLFGSQEQADASAAEMDKQCRAGVNVRIAFLDQLEPDLNKDLFLLSDKLCAEYLLTAGRAEIQSVRVYVPPNPEVVETINRRRRLLSSSELYECKSEEVG